MTPQVAVIGGGPAGLISAEVLSAQGCRVTIHDTKPSLGRKFLMAGKSGLNLTKDESFDTLIEAFGTASPWLSPIVRAFDARAIMAWAEGLGSEVFIGSTGRVFPTSMKASPLLRAWLARLQSRNVRWRTRWKWTGWDGGELVFETPDGVCRERPDAVVLALGGASWKRLGSDGAWLGILKRHGVETVPFAPSNAAVDVDWTDHMKPHFGSALKAVRWASGDLRSRGEAVISHRGLEGGGIYSLTPALRGGNPLSVDLAPDLEPDALVARLQRKPSRISMSRWFRSTLGLPPAKVAFLFEMAGPGPRGPEQWVRILKTLPVSFSGVRPLDEAISTAGGVSHSAVDGDLMLRGLPGVFCAGEMLDWEAPTGGYLLTGCLATGRWAGLSAARYAKNATTGRTGD